MKNFGELLEEAKWGKLTKEELAYVCQEIKNYKAGDKNDLYTMIHVLGRAGAVEYRKLIESFLYYPSDPMISKIALQTLCNYWGFTDQYLNQVKEFVKGVDWDEDNDIRLVALRTAGSWLHETSDPELLQLLVSVFEDAIQDCVVRAVSYGAIYDALGLGKIGIQSIVNLIEEERFDEIDFTPIEMAKKRLIAEKS